MSIDNILVYGASGVQGGAVARLLLSKGVKVRTITRNETNVAKLKEQGIEAFIGDLSDQATLKTANSGIDKVFLNLPIEHNVDVIKQSVINIVEAAKEANVKLIVINSNGFLLEEATNYKTVDIKREMIDYVKQSGIPWILVKPTLYMENFLIPGLVNGNGFFYPVPADKPIAWISSDDAAQYHYHALSHPELEGQTIVATGPEALTGNQLADRFSQLLGREITFHSLNFEDFESSLAQVLGGELATSVANFYRWIGANIDSLNYNVSLTPSEIQLTTLQEWFQQPFVKNILGA